MSRLLTSIAAAVAALSVAPAFAASTASATLGPIQITLYDLNPLDNIEASITFSNELYYYGDYVQSQAYDSYTGQNPSNSVYGVGPFDPISTTSSTSTSTATASVSGDGSAQGTTLSATGTALGTAAPSSNGSQYSSFYAYAYAPYYYYQSFVVSAGTAVVITLPSVLSASVTNSFDPALTYGYESAYASTSVSLSGTGASGTGQQNSSDSRSIGVNSMYVYDENATYGYRYTGSSASDSASMAVSFVNVSGGDLAGQVYMTANVSGNSYAAAVPEPGSYALMLAGLAAVGFVARRRRG